MHWTRKSHAWIGCAVIAISLAACGPSAEEQENTQIEEAWAALEGAKSMLDEKRGAVATAAAALEDAVAAETEDVSGLETAVATAEEAAVSASEDFGEKLSVYLNTDVMYEGEAPTERQLAAIRMKSSEDMLIAQEFIDKGGNYKRAIDIYETALLIDADNTDLQAALANAQEMRYMTEERLAQVKKKMTPDEVRELLGPVNLNFIKTYEDRGVTAWFYPREDQGAAAVFFEEKGGEQRVYEINYEATKPPESG